MPCVQKFFGFFSELKYTDSYSRHVRPLTLSYCVHVIILQAVLNFIYNYDVHVYPAKF